MAKGNGMIGLVDESKNQKRIKFCIDTYSWILLPTIRLSLVGNNHRIYTISLDFLCFRLIFCVDEDSY